MAEQRIHLGISSLDEQHEALGGMLKAFQLAVVARRPADEVRAIIDTALAAVRAHFQHEEALMGRSNFPGADAHSFEHRRLLLAAESLTEDALAERHAPEVLAENGDLLRAMFRDHIGREDLSLAEHLKSLEVG